MRRVVAMVGLAARRAPAASPPVVKAISHFGARVALSGDGRVLAVGEPGDDSGQVGVASDGTDRTAPDAGAVYIFQATAPASRCRAPEHPSPWERRSTASARPSPARPTCALT